VSTRLDEILWQVREAATCLLCANGSHCSSPTDCRHWATEHIAKANKVLAGGPVPVAVFEQGRGEITEVTDEAQLAVALDGGAVVTVLSVEVSS
jgi:hypothetical protein